MGMLGKMCLEWPNLEEADGARKRILPWYPLVPPCIRMHHPPILACVACRPYSSYMVYSGCVVAIVTILIPTTGRHSRLGEVDWRSGTTTPIAIALERVP
eukprot:scaffold284026_cov38-Tisochrysis_lutea.AAC.3